MPITACGTVLANLICQNSLCKKIWSTRRKRAFRQSVRLFQMRTGFESHLQAPTENRSRDLKGWLTTESKTVESSCHVSSSVFYNSKQSLCHIEDRSRICSSKRLQTMVALMLHVSFTLSHALRHVLNLLAVDLSIQHKVYFIQIWYLLINC